MKRTIHILPSHLADKIAAGEVVQRPDSVVKELLENSLDAGAMSITIIVEEGGKKLIQVSDDGSGLHEEDAPVAFQRHATSKISSYQDLEAIGTYGFRGEALASISAVAQVTLKTRRQEADVATVVQVDGGGSPRITADAREQGTTISVRNLFYNVPARRKFLKSNQTEFRHVHDVVQRAALSLPEISFRFISDGEVILDLKPATLPERVVDLFGERFFESLILLEEETEYVTLHGFVGKPSFTNKTRAYQFLFMNRRPISNRSLTHAVFSAYGHLMTYGSFPAFVLFLTIDPHRVDVNVHPSKMEVKFDDEQNIHRLVSTVVRRFVSGHDQAPVLSLVPSENIGEEAKLRFTDRQHSWPQGGAGAPAAPGQAIPLRPGGQPISLLWAKGDRVDPDILNKALSPGDLQLSTTEPTKIQHEGMPEEQERAILIWQLHRKYILSQIKNGLLIVDQHVAHERILYERALSRFASNMYTSQQLLFPETIQLSASDYTLVEELQPHLELLGFGVRLFGKNTVVVDAVPPDIKAGAERGILSEILGLYQEYRQDNPLDVRDRLAKSFSCKAAIKAGDLLTEQEMRALIDQLFATQMPYVCPHGRPIVVRISVDELDRRFGRL